VFQGGNPNVVQRVITEFIDDIDGSPAERTFTFAVDGTNYEIDLSAQNIAEFKAAIGGFVESARKVKASRSNNAHRPRGAGASGDRQSREQTRAVRQWARQHGHDIGNRGKIPASIQQAFDQAHTAA
jgi:nucleoid-associated protein Lsr2